MRANKELANLFDWAGSWLETGDIYYRDLIKNEVEVPRDNEGRFAACCRLHLIEFPQDAYYTHQFVDMVREWQARYPKLVG
jgi:hypothetical protein